MPLETRSRTTTKPLTPALSSNLRTRPTHTLTPRLAGAAPSSPANPPVRILRQHTFSPERNEEERPVSLGSNITPRSGARNSRLETESPSTPDTAARSRPLATDPASDVATPSHGLGITSPYQTPTHPRPRSTEQLSFLPTAGGRRVSGGSAASTKDESKFFRVDDVKGIATATRQRPKTNYLAQNASPRLSPSKVHSRPDGAPDEKFFYAQQQPPVRPQSHRSTLAMKLSTASAAASSTRSLPLQSQLASQSTHSPTTAPELRSQRQQSTQNLRQRSTSDAKSTSPTLNRRRSSSFNVSVLSKSSETGHRKSVSANSAAITPINTHYAGNEPHPQVASPSNSLTQQHRASQPPAAPFVTSPNTSSPRSTSIDSANTQATSISDTTFKPDIQPLARPPFQPRHARGSSETTAIQPVTKEQLEAAANARRERKVLDLEISNSSLLAINRTLEKELRKQNTELRRFRRLSRSGRLSLTPSNRIVSGASISTLATLEEADTDMDFDQHPTSPGGSDQDSPYDDDDMFSEDDDNSSSFTESSDMLRRRARDEKRLIQDLQRHQQILIDSQKLTQSIQRCLNFTDELIRDGNKALSYRVEPEEVRVGGRVLHHDEDEDEALSEVDFDGYREGMGDTQGQQQASASASLEQHQPRQGLLSPLITKDALEEAAMWANGLQGLDGTNQILPDQHRTESPSPAGELSPVILPER